MKRPLVIKISSLPISPGSTLPPSHFTSVVLLPLPAVPLPRPPPRTHTCRGSETLAPSSPRGVIVFCERCKVFTFLHNSNHKAPRRPLSILVFSFSCPLLLSSLISLFMKRPFTSRKKKLYFFHLAPSFPPSRLPSHLLPFPIFIAPQAPPLLASSFIPLFYMHPPPPPRSPLLPPVLCF